MNTIEHDESMKDLPMLTILQWSWDEARMRVKEYARKRFVIEMPSHQIQDY